MAVIAVLLGSIFLVAPNPADAQGVGVKGGYLYSSFNLEGAPNVLDSSNSWMAGLFFGGNRLGRVGLMIEINVLAKRDEGDMESTTIYYLQVPWLLKINARSSRNVSGYGIIGPAIDLRVGDDFGNLGDIDNIDAIERTDVSLVVGVGVELTRFIIEARGTWGLRNIVQSAEGVDVKSRTFAILFGLRFN